VSSQYVLQMRMRSHTSGAAASQQPPNTGDEHMLLNMSFNIQVRMTESSKAPDSSSGPLTRASVQMPLLTIFSYPYLF
jgi:hypothetical protein